MINIKEIRKFKTSDGHEFDNTSDAYAWQSCLDMKSLKKDKKIDKYDWVQDIQDKSELEIFLNYLRFYLKFKNVYGDYSELVYPISIAYNLKDCEFEIMSS